MRVLDSGLLFRPPCILHSFNSLRCRKLDANRLNWPKQRWSCFLLFKLFDHRFIVLQSAPNTLSSFTDNDVTLWTSFPFHFNHFKIRSFSPLKFRNRSLKKTVLVKTETDFRRTPVLWISVQWSLIRVFMDHHFVIYLLPIQNCLF